MSKNQISVIAKAYACVSKLYLTNVNIADRQFQAFQRKWNVKLSVSALGAAVRSLRKGSKVNSISKNSYFFLSANSIKISKPFGVRNVKKRQGRQ